MKKGILFFILLMCFHFLYAQEDQMPEVLDSIEIFLIEGNVENENNFIHLPLEERKKIASQYSSMKQLPDSLCPNYLDLEKVVLADSAILDSTHLRFLHWETQVVLLTAEGQKKIESLDIPETGLPFVITRNKKPITYAWLWDRKYKASCGKTFAVQDEKLGVKLKLLRGLCGRDIRFDKINIPDDD